VAEAQSFAARLAAGPSEALAVTKAALNTEASMDLGTALEAEARAQAGCMQHPNFKEAYAAFREKRKPRFT
jgi:enoyl-CoA hydratase/carnithine racemase